MLSAGCASDAGDDASGTRLTALEQRLAVLEQRLAERPAAEAGLEAAPYEELAARLDSRDALERLRAAQAFGHRLAELRLDVMKLLREGTPRQREALAVLMSSKATGDMAGELLAAHAANPDPRVRTWIDTALGRAGSAEAIDALLGDLAHPDEGVRVAAVGALGRIGDARAAAPLALLGVSGDGLAAGLAADALRDIGEPSVAFIAASWGTIGPRERAAILTALQPIAGEAVDQFLRERLEDPAPLVSLEAARVLGVRGDMGGRDLALDRLKSEDPEIARAARVALDAMETGP